MYVLAPNGRGVRNDVSEIVFVLHIVTHMVIVTATSSSESSKLGLRESLSSRQCKFQSPTMTRQRLMGRLIFPAARV